MTEAPPKVEPLPTPEPHSELEYVPYKLCRSEQEAIGRVITAGAELEQVVSIAFFKIINIDQLDGYTLFGAATIGSRLGRLTAAMQYKPEYQKERTALEKLMPNINDAINLRNMFAHGVLMGAHTKDNCLCYITTKNISSLDEETAVMDVKRIRTTEFSARAQKVENTLQKVRVIFDVTPLHERYVLRVAEEKGRRR